MAVAADRLGVILDISGSMHPFLEEIVRQIYRQFPHYELVLVEGCCVGWFARSEEQFGAIQIRQGGRAFFEDLAGKYLPGNGYSSIEKAGTANVIASVQYLVKEKHCDAIYFFSDFRDVVNEDGVEKLKEVLQGRKIFLDSIGLAPQEDLERLAKRSGGDVQTKQ
jgi:hypothetical protein